MLSRGALGLASPRTRRGIALSWSVLFILSLLMQYATFALAPAALAVHDEGLFELDGNAVSGAAAGEDWDHVFAGTDSADATAKVTDLTNSNSDDIFTGGGSKDEHDTTDWLWTTSKPQAKNDIAHAYAAAYTATNADTAGHTIVYFGLDKYDASGDNFVGFWFLQGQVHKTGAGNPPGSPFSGAHTAGDILVLADYTNGGGVSAFSVYKWVTSGGDVSTHLDTVATGVPCTGAPATDVACATTNTATETAPWAFEDKSGKTDFLAGEFFEGGIDLTALGLDTGCFTSFIAETRSSQSTDATLSDFAGGQFSFCVPPTIATQVKHDGQSTGSLGTINKGDSVTDTATLTGSKGTVTGSVEFFTCFNASAVPDCSTGGTSRGTKTLSGGSATSDAFTPSAKGFYCYRVEYTPPAEGSHYLAASHTNKTTECFKVVEAHIAITKKANPAGPVSAGDTVGFDITVTNDGDGTALNVHVSDPLPAGIDWAAGAPTGDTSGVSCAIAAGSLTCDDASMAAGDSFSVHISGATGPEDCGTITNKASVTTSNDGSADATDSVDVLCPDVKVTKTPDEPNNDIPAGQPIHFTIVVENIGKGIARDVTLNDPLPAGFDWTQDNANCVIAAGALTCDFGDMAAGAKETIHLRAPTSAVGEGANIDCSEGGSIDIPNVASASASNEGEDVLANNTDPGDVDVLCSALVIDKSVLDVNDEAPVNDPDLGVPGAKIGDTVTFKLHYTGSGLLENAFIVDVLPVGEDYVAGTASSNADFAFTSATFNSGTHQWTLRWDATGTLPNPADGTLTYDVKVLAAAAEQPQPLTNTATIDSDQTNPDSDTADIAVAPPPEELTPPPTDVFTPATGTGNPGFALMLVLVGAAVVTLAIGFVTPVPARTGRRRNR